ncbi:hypothetical protein NE237_022843 [Protea cynaroides]|uniref:Uncharacterized protein n=1 Tax=Protea cynaroides TaxID=273540 RepID=A0A9Q0HG29_9MAGN|nr:hypothetical protein NE237_022843 [Protea cynaroides]
MFQNQIPLKHSRAPPYMEVCNDNRNKNTESLGNQRKLKCPHGLIYNSVLGFDPETTEKRNYIVAKAFPFESLPFHKGPNQTLIPILLLQTPALMASGSSNNNVPSNENDGEDTEEKPSLELRLGANPEPLQGALGSGFHNGAVGEGSGSGPSGSRGQCGDLDLDLDLQVPRTLDCRIPEPTGVWFTLRSLRNREGVMLPQLSRAYIRVKNENVTVLIVKMYLVTRLGLTSEVEIDISCMGQPLLNSQTLRYVRDVIWRPRLTESLSTIASGISLNDTTLAHLMPLHYGKHCMR